MLAVAFSSMMARANDADPAGDLEPCWVPARRRGATSRGGCGGGRRRGRAAVSGLAGTSGGGTMLEIDQAAGSRADLAFGPSGP